MTKVKLENFSKFSDQECALMLQSRLLEALEIEDPTYLEWEMVNKFISIDYPSRISLGRLLNYYLRKNTQNIAGTPVNAWLKKYLEKNQRISREPDTFYQYSINSPEINKLSEKDQIKLMRIFRLYDYFLIKPIVNWDDTVAEYIMRFPMYLSQSLQEIKTEMEKASKKKLIVSTKASEKIAIKQALQKYPKLGEQNISSYPLKIKSFDRPVRPSIRNWLYDYTSHLGQTGHSSMDRTNFLFRSENTARLNSQEREKLSIILKSFDENTHLPIDTEAQEIVFSDQGSVNKEQYRDIPPAFKTPSPPQQTPRQSFAKSYSKTEQKPPAQSRIPDTRYPTSPAGRQIPNTEKKFEESDGITYINPYPKPGSHEVKTDNEQKDITNIRFSEGTPKDARSSVSALPKVRPFPSGSGASGIPQGQTLANSSRPNLPSQKPYVPSHPKNIIYPHYPQEIGGKPEPRVNGNVVDLSEK